MSESIGPPEPVWFKCPECHKPVLTLWAPGHHGLLRGDYDLVGDWIFHRACFDEFAKDFANAHIEKEKNMTDKEHAERAIENAETAAQKEITDDILRQALIDNIVQEFALIRGDIP